MVAMERSKMTTDTTENSFENLIVAVVTGKLDVCGYNVVKENADTAPKGG